jgi:GT2 family glycosyltransferase
VETVIPLARNSNQRSCGRVNILQVPKDERTAISVVIAAYNAGPLLDECLDALSKSSVPPLECVVVDDGSTDNSSAIAEQHGARVITLRGRGGPARARNVGARQALGEIVLFLDADVRIHPDAIARIAEHFQRDPSLDAVIGAYDDSPAAAPFVSQYRNLLHCSTHRAGRPQASTFWSACGAIRKEAFLRCRGFDERYTGPAIEDIEFGSRLKAAGGRILLDPAVQGQHLKCWTFRNMIETDILHRGIPWTRLILRSGSMPDDLNVRWSQRFSVMLVFALGTATVFGAGYTAFACALALIRLNWPFYRLVSDKMGPWLALRAVPLHFLFHFYCGLAFLLGVGIHLLGSSEPAPSVIPDEQIS